MHPYWWVLEDNQAFQAHGSDRSVVGIGSKPAVVTCTGSIDLEQRHDLLVRIHMIFVGQMTSEESFLLDLFQHPDSTTLLSAYPSCDV